MDFANAVGHGGLPAGYALFEYRIESLLGSGGFGLTYLARDQHLDCLVAIKEYLPGHLAVRTGGETVCPRSQQWQPDYRAGLARFLAEARTLASFRHPNIIRVLRFFEANGTAYMVMDYERGQPLNEWRRSRPAPGEDEVLRMFLPLLEGLEVVHQGGVTHRDIQPANIYVRESDGSLVLLDFGAARPTSAAQDGLTRVVTPGYAPFEQYHARGAQGPWSDIYALGGVLYWLITGERPLEAPSRVKGDTLIPAARRARRRFSPAFLAAVDWALQTDDKRRPHSVAEFRAALAGRRELPVDELPEPVPAAAAGAESRRKTMAFGAAGAGLLVLLLGAAILVAHRGAGEDPVPAAPAGPAKPAAVHGTPIAKSTARPRPASATVSLDIRPYGEIYLDGKKMGASPPLDRIPVSPGQHRLEIHGNAMPFIVAYSLDLKAGEAKTIAYRFGND